MGLIEILNYLREDTWDMQVSTGLVSCLWLIAVVSWFVDLYPLIKKKSQRETLAVIAFPGLVAVCVATLSTLLLGITTGPLLNDGQVFMEWRSSVELLITAVAFLIIWFFCIRVRGKNNNTWIKRLFWAISHIPDFIIAVCMLVVSLGRLAGGRYFLTELGTFSAVLGFRDFNIFAWGFAYGVMMLLVKSALLFVAVLTGLITARIPVGSYREAGHPVRRFVWYALFCQNAYFRGIVAMILPLVAFLAVLIFGGSISEMDLMIITLIFMMCSSTAAFTMFAMGPLVRTLRSFEVWGDRNQKLEQFCLEYFNEPPILRIGNYTVTKHFFIDERSVVEIYYLEMLKGWKRCFEGDDSPMRARTAGGFYDRVEQVFQGETPPPKPDTMAKSYTVSKAERSGWEWRIDFADGKSCCIEWEDKAADEILKTLKQYMEAHQIRKSPEGELLTLRGSRKDGIYEKIQVVCIGGLILSFLLMMLSIQ